MTTLTSGKEAERVLRGRGEREPAVSREGQGDLPRAEGPNG